MGEESQEHEEGEEKPDPGQAEEGEEQVTTDQTEDWGLFFPNATVEPKTAEGKRLVKLSNTPVDPATINGWVKELPMYHKMIHLHVPEYIQKRYLHYYILLC